MLTIFNYYFYNFSPLDLVPQNPGFFNIPGLLDVRAGQSHLHLQLEVLHHLVGHAAQDRPLLRRLLPEHPHVPEAEDDLEAASRNENQASRSSLQRDAPQCYLWNLGKRN